MGIIINIIGFACVGVLWIVSEPTIRLRNWIFKGKNNMISRLLGCAMCSTFHIYLWTQLIVTHEFDILGAAIASVLAEFISRKLNSGSVL